MDLLIRTCGRQSRWNATFGRVFADGRPPRRPEVAVHLSTRRGWLGLGVLLTLLFALAPAASAQLPVSREYQIKAVFLFNFAQFVDWPPSAFPDPQAPLVIGVLGEDPFGAALDEAVRGELVHQRPLVVRRYRHVEEIHTCHVLFISRSEAVRLTPILAQLRGRQILAVSDIESFAHRGGAIQFVSHRNKIRLRINVDATRSATLTISSKLLRPAEIVSSERRSR